MNEKISKSTQMEEHHLSTLTHNRFDSSSMATYFQRWAAISTPYTLTAVLVVLLPLELVQRGFLPWAAAGAAAWAFFQGVGSIITRPILKRIKNVESVRTLMVLMSVMTGVAVVAVELSNGISAGIVLVVVSSIVAILWSVFQIVNRAAVAQWGDVWIRRVGPTGRVSAAVNAVVATAIAVSPMPLWVGFLFIVGLFGSVIFTKEFTGLPSTQIVGKWSHKVAVNNGLFALAGYGTVALYVPLVSLTAGAAWVGASMVAYALGALFAPMVARKIKHAQTNSPTMWVVAAGATTPIWFFTGIVPEAGWASVLIVLLVRLISGTVLFVVEGNADVEAAKTGTFAPALTGRNIAIAVVGALAGITIALGLGFWGAFIVLTLITATAVVVSYITDGNKKH
jgi:hypothetical protein